MVTWEADNLLWSLDCCREAGTWERSLERATLHAGRLGTHARGEKELGRATRVGYGAWGVRAGWPAKALAWEKLGQQPGPVLMLACWVVYSWANLLGSGPRFGPAI